MGIKIEARGRIDRQRTELEDTVVEWRVLPDDERWRRLDPADSLRLRNHSPSGFAWGYEGSGPSQLALALLYAATDRRFAVEHYQRLKRDAIARIAWVEETEPLDSPSGPALQPAGPWLLYVDVERWLASSLIRDGDGERPLVGVTIDQPISPEGWLTPTVDVERIEA